MLILVLDCPLVMEQHYAAELPEALNSRCAPGCEKGKFCSNHELVGRSLRSQVNRQAPITAMI
jgi:hypothetical protein